VRKMREATGEEVATVEYLRDNGLDDDAVLAIVTIARCNGFSVRAVGDAYLEARSQFQPDPFERRPARHVPTR
jgi:hypothetical protein